jgi:alkylation response protein AidB-like acyl-CoA dehydrogenase
MSTSTISEQAVYPAMPEFLLKKISDRATALDQGDGQARAVFEELALEKVLDIGAPFNTGGGLAHMARVLSSVAGECLSTSFSMWAHRMTIEYLAAAATPYARQWLPQLSSGTVLGITGMAPTFRELAGCGSLEITATADGDGYILDGPIRWASNLYEDSLLVTAVRTDKGEKLVVALPLSTPGITAGKPFSLLALGSTGSSFMTLSGVRIGHENILTADFDAFLSSVRPTFMVLQTSLCVGLAQTSLAEARECLVGVNSVFAPEVDALSGKLSLVSSAMLKTADTVGTAHAPTRKELLSLRLAGAELATGAAAIEAKTAGGKGYASSSGASRRFREAAFIPVQSPSEAQLRWELASCN